MELSEARDLIANRQLWPRVRSYLVAGGEMKDFSLPENRLLLLDKETLSKMDGIQTSYATKNLEYVVKSVIWYAVFTGAGFILFKRRDLF